MLYLEELEQRCVPSRLIEGFHFSRVGMTGTVTGFDLATGKVLETFSFQLNDPAAPVGHWVAVREMPPVVAPPTDEVTNDLLRAVAAADGKEHVPSRPVESYRFSQGTVTGFDLATGRTLEEFTF